MTQARGALPTPTVLEPNEGSWWDSVPPDVRFCRETCVDGSPALVDRHNRAAVT